MRQQRPSVQYQPSTGFRLTSTHMHPANRASSGLVCLGQASKCWHDATKLIAAEPVHWDGLPAHRQRTLVHLYLARRAVSGSSGGAVIPPQPSVVRAST